MGEGPETWKRRLAELYACSWYWGDISWKWAEKLLLLCPEGYFLVRDSRSDSHLFTVSYHLDGKVYHSRVSTFGTLAHLGDRRPLHCSESVVELIQHVVEQSQRGEHDMLMHRRGAEAEASKMQLSRPLGRLELLPSLQYLCRLKIRQKCPPAAISSLRLPPNLLAYVTHTKYLIPDLEASEQVLKIRAENGLWPVS